MLLKVKISRKLTLGDHIFNFHGWNKHSFDITRNNLMRITALTIIIIIIIMTLFKCQMYLARTALIGDTFQIELEFRNVGFCGEGKTGVPGEKPLGARTRTNNKLNPHMTPRPGIEPGPHWWEASALTTAPSLLPSIIIISTVTCYLIQEIKIILFTLIFFAFSVSAFCSILPRKLRHDKLG